MRFIQQVLIIAMVTFGGEVLHFFIPLPVPGNIYGMILLFILLLTGLIKESQVKDVGRFLLDIMPILFIPSAVGIITEFSEIKSIWWQIIIITIVTTVMVMAVSGLVTQMIVRKKQKDND